MIQCWRTEAFFKSWSWWCSSPLLSWQALSSKFIFSLLGLSFFFIYVLIGSVVTSIVAFYSSSKTFKEVRFCHAITYTNAPILGKDLHGNRKENYPKMMTASIIWLILHTLTLTMLMIWVGAMDPSDPPSPLVWPSLLFLRKPAPLLFLVICDARPWTHIYPFPLEVEAASQGLRTEGTPNGYSLGSQYFM